LKHRRSLLNTYIQKLESNASVRIIDAEGSKVEHAAWLFTIRVEDRTKLQSVLLAQGIESSQVHYRNDRYSIFDGRNSDLPNMDSIEDEYLVLPLHTKMTESDVIRVCEVINGGW
jgi:dTDP-4-amino-4,6-dideoxygalactose transaminase